MLLQNHLRNLNILVEPVPVQHGHSVTVHDHDDVIADVAVKFVNLLHVDLDRFCVDQLPRQVIDVVVGQDALVQGV